MNAVTPHQPATVAHWAAFMRPIAASVRNPPSEGDFKARVVAVATAIPEASAALLAKPWLQAEAMRKFQFWPAVADVHELLAPELADTRQRAAAEAERLRLAPPPPKAERTADEIAAVRAKAAAFKAEAQTESRTARVLSGRDVTFSDDRLLIAYEASAAGGNAAAAFRAAILRKKLGR